MQTSETKSQHTPGPWTAEPYRVGDSAYKIVYDADGHWLAEVFDVPNAPDTAAADARLIAAAPELLEALRNLVGLAEMRGSLHEYRAALDEARAAIAKATGGA